MALTAPSSTLTGQTIAASYDQVLFLDAAAGVTEATLKIVSGTTGKTALSISDEHVLIKGVDTNNASGFEVQQTDGTSILKVAAGTPSVLVSGNGTKLYFADAGGEYISGSASTSDLTITAGNDIFLDAGAAGSVYASGAAGTANTAFGNDAGIALTGNYNTLYGSQAGKAITSGANNVAIGRNSLATHVDGSYNIAIGVGAMGDTDEDTTVDGSLGNIMIGEGAGGGAWATAVSNYNIGIGYEAMRGVMNGALNNTAVGKDALKALTIGGDNVAIGSGALTTEDVGDRAVAVGTNSLYSQNSDSNNEDSLNVGVGHGAGYYNVTGTNNTYVGGFAGTGASGADAAAQSNSDNTAIGKSAMVAVTTGSDNTGVGKDALFDIQDGNGNTAIGIAAGDNLTGGDYNTFVGRLAGRTTTSVQLAVAIGNGAMDSGNVTAAANGTVAVGSAALSALISGENNTAVGFRAGAAITDGDYNTLLGHDAGLGIIGGLSNTCVGWLAGAAIVNQDHNVAIGHYAMPTSSHASSNYNIAIGSNTLDAIVGNVATSNIAIGYNAGTNLLDGDNNTLVGNAAGAGITSASNCTLIGSGITGGVLTGDDNTCVGLDAGAALAGGNQNTCVGKDAGNTISSGAANIIIGAGADTDSSDRNGAIAIGQGAITSAADNTAAIGDQAYVTVINFNSSGNGWANTSDERIKKDIVDSDLGLDFINKLRPIKYKDIPPSEWPEVIRPKKLKESHYTSKDKQLDGLIAQEVIQVAKDLGVTFSGCGSGDEPDSEKQMLEYAKFVVPLIKAVQELSQQVEDLKKQIN